MYVQLCNFRIIFFMLDLKVVVIFMEFIKKYGRRILCMLVRLLRALFSCNSQR